jgi:tape measure domain-containing protein
MDRVITTLGQIRMKGRVQGDEMLQLAEAGINANAYLERAFHLTPQQLQKAQQAGKISAAAAIPVILKGMDDQFHGLMEKQSHTLGGMWSNFHDAAQQGLMNLANPFMPAMKRWLGEATTYLGGPDGKSGFFARASKFMNVLPGNVTAGRANFAAYNIGEILGAHKFDPAIEKGVRVVHNLGVIVKDVLVPALKDLSVVLAPVVLILEHLDTITGFVADHSDAFRVVVDVLMGSFLAYQAAVLAVNIGVAAYNLVTGIAKIKTVAFKDATNAQRLAIVAWKIAVWGATAAQWLWNAAMDANPIGIAILAIAGLATAFIIAYDNIKPFRDFINGLWDDMKGFQKWITEVWNPTKWSSHSEATTQMQAPGLVGGATDVPSQNGGSAVHPGPLIMPGMMADGGTAQRGGMTWVGERGPELLNLPTGSKVIPLPRTPEAVGRGPVHVHVMLNQREIAQAVYDDMGDRVARR